MTPAGLFAYPVVATPDRERMFMPEHMPQNGEEAAYISFALVDALGELLVAKGVLTREEIDGFFLSSAASLDKSSNFAGARGAEFLRNIVRSRKE
jgi:hypothetical protein